MEIKILARSLKMALIAGSLAASGTASAAIIEMMHGNSTVNVDDQTGSAIDWMVDNSNDQLYTQSYYYRIGSTGGESDLSSLMLTGSSLSTSTRSLELTYSSADFTIDILYGLTGGSAGSGSSVLSQDVTITNTSNTTLDIHFFQYNDFDLQGIGGQFAEQTNANTVVQTYGTTQLTEQVGTPAPTAFQVDGYPTLDNLLNDSLTTNLNGQSSYTGDATWAWQWDLLIAAGSSEAIGESMRLDGVSAVPVPAAVWLFGSGLLGLIGVARRTTNV